jgi:hypothetical protein
MTGMWTADKLEIDPLHLFVSGLSMAISSCAILPYWDSNRVEQLRMYEGVEIETSSC